MILLSAESVTTNPSVFQLLEFCGFILFADISSLVICVLWFVSFTFFYYHLSGIPGGSEDNAYVRGAFTEKTGWARAQVIQRETRGGQAAQSPFA